MILGHDFGLRLTWNLSQSIAPGARSWLDAPFDADPIQLANEPVFELLRQTPRRAHMPGKDNRARHGPI